MKCIILAAGQWTRLRPITDEIPKPMVKILGKPILEYLIENIYDRVDEIIIVVWYKYEKIVEYFWDNYNWTKITYHHQPKDKKWTWSAIMWLDIKDDVFLLYWDSILYKKDLEKILNLDWYGCLVQEVTDPSKYGIFKQNSNWFAIEIVEKPKELIWNLANLWGFKFSSEIFELVNKISLSSRWEYEITDAINLFLEKHDFKLEKIDWKFIDVGYPEDIERAEKYIIKKRIVDKYSMVELTRKLLDEKFDSFMGTLENLKPNFDINKTRILEYFDKINWDSKIFVIIDENSQVIWSITIIIEYKLIRWWVKAWRIEDVAVKSGYQWYGLWTELMKKAISYAESQWVYKITLSWRDQVVPFYEKFWFTRFSTNMKKYY